MAPACGPAAATDRRHRRRQETIEEILDIAVQIMAEQGVAGLSVGEIARRMGIRPPSVYVYFPSKHALYDALFARGARLLLAAMQQVNAPLPDGPTTLHEILLPATEAAVRSSMPPTRSFCSGARSPVSRPRQRHTSPRSRLSS